MTQVGYVNNDTNALIGAVLREIRKDLLFSLTDAEQRTGIKGTTIASYERGERTVSLDQLLRLADGYQVDRAHLVQVIEQRKANDDATFEVPVV